MARRKKPRKKIPKVVKLTAEQYWKLKAHAEELSVAETKKHLVEKQREVLESEMQHLTLKLAVIGDKISERAKDLESIDAEYDKVRLEIEKDIGQSLKNCNIDPLEYTVHKEV